MMKCKQQSQQLKTFIKICSQFNKVIYSAPNKLWMFDSHIYSCLLEQQQQQHSGPIHCVLR